MHEILIVNSMLVEFQRVYVIHILRTIKRGSKEKNMEKLKMKTQTINSKHFDIFQFFFAFNCFLKILCV